MSETIIEKLIRTKIITEQDIQEYINKKANNINVEAQRIETFSVIKNGVLVKFDKRDLINGHYNIPQEVKKIGIGAFSYCGELKSVNIHDGVERISNRAFSCSGLVVLTIPKNVKYIGKELCLCCVDLAKVEFKSGITVINDFAFANCSNLISVKLHEGTKIIGISAFKGCEKLKDIALPNSVNTICDGAFGQCYSLNNLNIPKDLKKVGLLDL